MLEARIGLEIHVQLATRTKMFCACAQEFAASPNTRVCPVCLGLPGALPVLNARAVELAVRAALGLGCRVHPESSFARKHYFYPDLPKGYQITQHDRPLATGGLLALPAGEEPARPIRIRRVHLEEDTGRSLHDRLPGASALDMNRAGVALIEIVTEPDLRSPAETRAFLGELKQALEYLEVSDCSMEEGSLRVDANVSMGRGGGASGVPVEIKNLNSFRHVERALEHEVKRQVGVLAGGGAVAAATRLWDPHRRETRLLRSKEQAPDYRYIPEPDLLTLRIAAPELAAAREHLPEMPRARRGRFERALQLPAAAAGALTRSRPLADYFEGVVAAGVEPRNAASWVLGEVLAAVNARDGRLAALPVAPAALAELLVMVAEGRISRSVARGVFAVMAETGETARSVLSREGVGGEADEAELSRRVEEVLARRAAEVERYRKGEERLLGYLIGEVAREVGPGVDPLKVRALLRERL